MPSGIKTPVEKNIWKIVYPTGTIRYRVEFAGKGTELYALEKSLPKARAVKAEHLINNPELIAMTPAEKRAASIKRAQVIKVPDTKFIAEYVTRPGTYSLRIARAKEASGKKIILSETVVGLANAKKRETELIAEMEKKLGRGIDVIDYKPPNPLYKKAVADVKTQMTKYNKLGYYPDDLLIKISDKYNFPYVKGEGSNAQLSRYVKDAGLIDKTKLTALTPKYIDVVEKWKKYKGDKTKVGVKRALLEEAGLPSKASNVGSFRTVLKNLKIHVPENIKLPGNQIGRTIDRKLKKVSSSNIESFLSGNKMGDLIVDGKKGSLLDKMHLGDKTGLIRVGEMGYGSSELNRNLGGGFRRTEGAERHRTSLNKHVNRIIEKYKGNPNAMYEISSGPDSFDQKKFKNSLQEIFGKTKGTVPLSKYIDQIINTEVQLMGYATDGLITARRLDPLTLERMAPSSNLSGSRTLGDYGNLKSDMTLQDLGAEKRAAGPKRVTPLLEELSMSANLAKQNADLNIKNFKLTPTRMKSIVTSIDKMLAGGLLDAATAGKYDEISKLAKKCTLLRADGGRIAFAEGGPCAQAQRAVKNLNQEEVLKVGSNIDDAMKGPMGKLRDASRRFLQGFKTSGSLKGKIALGAGAVIGGGGAAALVQQFRNDNPNTYLTNDRQMEGMIIADDIERDLEDMGFILDNEGKIELAATGALSASMVKKVYNAARAGEGQLLEMPTELDKEARQLRKLRKAILYRNGRKVKRITETNQQLLRETDDRLRQLSDLAKDTKLRGQELKTIVDSSGNKVQKLVNTGELINPGSSGRIMSALGLRKGVLGLGLNAFMSPAIALPTAAMSVARDIKSGKSTEDTLTNPFTYLPTAFMKSGMKGLAKMGATRGLMGIAGLGLGAVAAAPVVGALSIAGGLATLGSMGYQGYKMFKDRNRTDEDFFN